MFCFNCKVFNVDNEQHHLGPALNGTLTVASVLFNLFMNALELLVAFIQAYVFTMLSAVFIGLAQEEHTHKEEVKIEEKQLIK